MVTCQIRSDNGGYSGTAMAISFVAKLVIPEHKLTLQHNIEWLRSHQWLQAILDYYKEGS